MRQQGNIKGTKSITPHKNNTCPIHFKSSCDEIRESSIVEIIPPTILSTPLDHINSFTDLHSPIKPIELIATEII